MDFHFTPEQIGWREEVRTFLIENITPELEEEMEFDDQQNGPHEQAFRKKVGEKGWYGLNWPKAYGGLEKTAMEQFIFVEEFLYAGAPRIQPGPLMMGPTIIRHGTEENKQMFLPGIVKGEIDFALGYSEPNAGTDLASLRTRAELIGDEWVINGQKTWNTHGHRVTHQWLCVRTDPSLPKHKGLSVIAVPMNSAGITIREVKTWGDHRVNEVFFEDVRVPKNHLIGEVNKGWNYITDALDFERIVLGASAHIRRLFDKLVLFCKQTIVDGEALITRPEVRMRLAELDMDLEVARLFGLRAASMIDAGKLLSAEASMMKTFSTELYTKVTDWGMQIMNLYGQLNGLDTCAPMGGAIEHAYRMAPFYRFGGGTNEVQRNILAQRGLGLPR